MGSGLRPKTDFRKPVRSLVPKHISLISDNVRTFIPSKSVDITDSRRELSYDVLVVAAGLQINWNAIKGLREALADSASGVSSIYSYSTCDKVWNDILKFFALGRLFSLNLQEWLNVQEVRQSFMLGVSLNTSRSSSKDHVDGMGQIQTHWPQWQNFRWVFHRDAHYVCREKILWRPQCPERRKEDWLWFPITSSLLIQETTRLLSRSLTAPLLISVTLFSMPLLRWVLWTSLNSRHWLMLMVGCLWTQRPCSTLIQNMQTFFLWETALPCQLQKLPQRSPHRLLLSLRIFGISLSMAEPPAPTTTVTRAVQ